jgi:hypothetical protein
MSSKINWVNLRSWNGSQQSAFEELCCQLAAHEQVPPNSRFIRKGTPDAGVECFWTLPNSDEWAWQAKFFTSVEDSQWKQLDESVKTALDKHPQLVAYTICIPLDRQDPRKEKQKWFMDKWDIHVKTWEGWANDKGKSVQFIYWGEHEIFERLTREEHRGRYLFWFRSELFSQNWFQDRLDEAIANAGSRYSPEFNVELPISRLFDGLGRTESFFNRIKVLQRKVTHSFSDFIRSEKKLQNKLDLELLKNRFNQFLESLSIIKSTDISPIDLNKIADLLTSLKSQGYEYIEILRKIGEEEKQKNQSDSNQEYKAHYGEIYGSEIHHLYELSRAIASVQKIIDSNEARLTNVPVLLVLGEAGTGKSHLFCDVASNRIKFSLPTIILLGEQFNDDEPWSQIIGLLGLSCTKEELLGALEAAAIARNSKALIFIDALNEGEGKKLWKKHFSGMLATLSRFPRLGLAVSVRTPYEDIVIPKELDIKRLVREKHYGFANHEYQATRTFFNHFRIKRPSVPLLNPEFQNPLFLKLFCVGLHNRGLTEVPSGFHGITTVFQFLIDSVNEKLGTEEYLNFDEKSQLVQKYMLKLAEIMAASGKQWVDREEAKSVAETFYSSSGYQNSLFRHLLVEGLLAEDRFWQGNDERTEGIRFSYERFADHLTVKYLLDQHLDSTNPSQSFLQDGPLGLLIKSPVDCWHNLGLLEALCIQIPERIHRELAEVASYCANFKSVRESFVKSIVWRDPSSILEATRQYINEHIRDDDDCTGLLDAFLTVSSNPNHPFNADFLHDKLKKLKLADRDARWSTFLHYQYGEHGAVDRLIDWAWSCEDKSHICDESIRLCATALAWFLTTSNRFLRDQSTKALVALLTPRIDVLRQVLAQFIDVNDLYVLERLFAVAYGCAMRSNDSAALAKLAQNVYKWIFESEEPVPHLLLRDYARGVVEVAIYRQLELGIDATRIKPPYKGKWLEYIPSEGDLKEHTKKLEEGADCKDRSLSAIKSSVLGWGSMLGDFARYEVESNCYNWSSQELGKPSQLTRKEMYELFLKSLTERQSKSWKSYEKILENIKLYRRLDQAKKLEIFDQEFTEQELEEVIIQTNKSLRSVLGKRKTLIFEEVVVPYLNSPYIIENIFDLEMALRWIYWRVFDLGWTIEDFGDFDSMVDYGHHSREARKAERIGKKYQCLALHEFLARVSDHFKFRGDHWNNSDEGGYQGPWQTGLRDIDPSCLLRETTQFDSDLHSRPWWSAPKYEAWNSGNSHLQWLKEEESLPSAEAIIKVINPNDDSLWLALENHGQWDEPVPLEKDKYSCPRRQIWYMLKSYIVNKGDMEFLYDWACQQNFMGRWMPESHEQTGIFLGEFCWSPSFNYHNIPYFNHDGWTQGHEKIPREIHVSTDKYLKESSTYDCSINESYTIYLPSHLLINGMQLDWNGSEGNFFDSHGKLIAFDPSLKEPGSNASLVRQDSLLDFLQKNDYDILWTLLGEKCIFDGMNFHGRLELSGAFCLQNGTPTGVVNHKLLLPDQN